MKHLVFFHLFNDYSGSPKILKTVIQNLLDRNFRIDLVTSRGGILDKLKISSNLKRYSYRYHFSPHPVLTIIRYLGVQIYTFFFAFRYILDKDVVFYINTLLPTGPALAGKLMGKRIIYHYHENAFAKGIFYKVLAGIMQELADEIICVSSYQASFLKKKRHVIIIPNALPETFINQLHPCPGKAFKQKEILMIGSLKLYKGTLEFFELAGRLPQFHFTLVINDTQSHINKFITEYKLKIRNNLSIYPRQEKVSSFYNRASIVLNLSNKSLFIETFGLTALEAMYAGLPVIVPTVGGIAELVEDNMNGYKIDVQNLDAIEKKIMEILTNNQLYQKLAENALSASKKYNERKMIDTIVSQL